MGRTIGGIVRVSRMGSDADQGGGRRVSVLERRPHAPSGRPADRSEDRHVVSAIRQSPHGADVAVSPLIDGHRDAGQQAVWKARALIDAAHWYGICLSHSQTGRGVVST
jgi:hypothetical protein